MTQTIVTVDFETEAIVGNPITHPPKPVGYAVWVPEQEPTYLAWGHPSENNCSYKDGHDYLMKLRDSGCELLFHNAGFDLSVWEEYFGNAKFTHTTAHGGFNWKRFHDTMYLLFLADPYANTLSLKPSAERWLNLPPTEQTELKNWILNHVAEATPTTWGAYISRAPGDLVARYAIGDVVRTRNLFDLLHAKIVAEGMEAAYDRERKLFPTMLFGTKRGVRVDRDTLEHHTSVYDTCHAMATDQLAARLGCPVGHLDDDELFADALERSGAVTEWVLTEKSKKRSMARDNLHIVIPEVKTLLDYRGALATCLNVFMHPWLGMSKEDGRLHPNWNQVKQAREMDRGTKNKGTKTGRLSSDSPNFQNVPTEFITSTGDPLPVPEGLHPLPQLRRYILPEEGHVWLKRDFASQELRILAHFEDGQLCQAYKLNPSLDVHQMARELIQSLIGIMYARKDIKITGFSLIYGSGVRGLSSQLGRPYNEAYTIRASYLAALPGVQDLMEDVQARGKAGQAIRTWGGRVYYVEPSKEVKGKWMDFAYKLLNYLIQGSAADQTKESINDWEDARKWYDIFMATVHDEINISTPEETWKESMRILREAMNKDRMDVPVLSEGFVGQNWADLESCE
jgi:DNA polymerase I-like protein with 3'-5' exonuclease and polymerase domains